MRAYSVLRKSDGVSWEDVPFLEVDRQPWFFVPDVGMRMQVMWDSDRLYVHQLASERNIRAEVTEHLGMVWNDSCMEFFLSPVEGDERYFNFELNPNGAMMLGFGYGKNDRVCMRTVDPTAFFNIRTSVSSVAGGVSWEIQYEIPASFIATFFPGFSLREGMTLMANCYKCGDLTDHEHYLTWNEMTCVEPDYHRSCDFGRFILRP